MVTRNPISGIRNSMAVLASIAISVWAYWFYIFLIAEQKTTSCNVILNDPQKRFYTDNNIITMDVKIYSDRIIFKNYPISRSEIIKLLYGFCYSKRNTDYVMRFEVMEDISLQKVIDTVSIAKEVNSLLYDDWQNSGKNSYNVPYPHGSVLIVIRTHGTTGAS